MVPVARQEEGDPFCCVLTENHLPRFPPSVACARAGAVRSLRGDLALTVAGGTAGGRRGWRKPAAARMPVRAVVLWSSGGSARCRYMRYGNIQPIVLWLSFKRRSSLMTHGQQTARAPHRSPRVPRSRAPPFATMLFLVASLALASTPWPRPQSMTVRPACFTGLAHAPPVSWFSEWRHPVLAFLPRCARACGCASA